MSPRSLTNCRVVLEVSVPEGTCTIPSGTSPVISARATGAADASPLQVKSWKEPVPPAGPAMITYWLPFDWISRIPRPPRSSSMGAPNRALPAVPPEGLSSADQLVTGTINARWRAVGVAKGARKAR